MKKVNHKSGTLVLKSVRAEKVPFCRFIARAAQRFGEVSEVSYKGVFSHFRFSFLAWSYCLRPEHERIECRFDIDPETLEIKNYRQFPVMIADQWFTSGR